MADKTYEIKLNVSIEGEEKIAGIEQAVENLQRKAQEGVSVGSVSGSTVTGGAYVQAAGRRSSRAQRALAQLEAEQKQADAIRERMGAGTASQEDIQTFARIGTQQAIARRELQINRMREKVAEEQARAAERADRLNDAYQVKLENRLAGGRVQEERLQRYINRRLEDIVDPQMRTRILADAQRRMEETGETMRESFDHVYRRTSRLERAWDAASLAQQKADEQRERQQRSVRRRLESVPQEDRSGVIADARLRMQNLGETSREAIINATADYHQHRRETESQSRRNRAVRRIIEEFDDPDERVALGRMARRRMSELGEDRNEAFAAAARRIRLDRAEAQRLDSAQFAAQLAGQSPGAQLAMLRQRMAGLDPNSLEYARLLRQANALAPRTGLRAMMSASRGVAMNVMFGAWEVGSAVIALRAAQGNQALAANRDEYTAALIEEIMAPTQGIFGSMIGGAMDLFGAGPASIATELKRADAMQKAITAANLSRRSREAHDQINIARLEGTSAAAIGGEILRVRDRLAWETQKARDEAAFLRGPERLGARGTELKQVLFDKPTDEQIKAIEAAGGRVVRAEGARGQSSGVRPWLVYGYSDEELENRNIWRQRLTALEEEITKAERSAATEEHILRRQQAIARLQERGIERMLRAQIADTPAGAKPYELRRIEMQTMHQAKLTEMGIPMAGMPLFGQFVPRTADQAQVIRNQRLEALALQRDEERRVELEKIKADSEIRVMRAQTRSAQLGAAGFSREAALHAVDAQFGAFWEDGQLRFGPLEQLRIEKAPNYARLYDAMREAYEFARQSAERDYSRTVIARQGGLRAGALALSGQEVAARTRQAISQFTESTKGMSPLSPEYWMKLAETQQQIQGAVRNEAFERQSIQLDQASRREQLRARRNRDMVGAQAWGIAGAARQEELSLLSRGLLAEAAVARSLGQEQLELLRRDYMESFRGEQIDLRSFSISNVRDSQDPREVLNEIREALEGLGKPGGTGEAPGEVELGQSTINALKEVHREVMREILTN